MTIWDHGTFETHLWDDKKVEVTFHGERLSRALRAVPDRPARPGGLREGLDDPPHGPAGRPRPASRCPSGSCRCWPAAGSFPRARRSGPSRSSGTGCGRSPTSSPGGCAWRAATSTRSPRPIPRSAASSRDLGMREAVFDGEIVAFDDDGRPELRAPAAAHPRDRRPARCAAWRRARPVVYAIFDLLYLDGHSLMALPYEQRRDAAGGAGAGRPGVAGAGGASGARQRAAAPPPRPRAWRASWPSGWTPATSRAGAPAPG